MKDMSEENTAKQKKDPMIWCLILMALGVIFLLDSLRIADAGELISTYWPVAIMAIGVRMVLQARPKRPKPVADSKELATNEHLRLSKTFGSVGVKIDSKSFSGGKVSTLFGDVLVDLSEANIRSGEKTLKLNGVIGDISVSLPKNVKV
ncbi:cell wall-active antibiotics response protein, partial [bacterium]|nr:cell wall-active antibiotics response protein [bacterium]